MAWSDVVLQCLKANNVQTLVLTDKVEAVLAQIDAQGGNVRVSRDREQRFHRIVSTDFRGS